MPKIGYKSITLPEKLYNNLQENAKEYGTTCQNIIRMLLENPINVDAFDETFLHEKFSENPGQSTSLSIQLYFPRL